MSHPDCFGTLFPDPNRDEYARHLAGKVLSIEITNMTTMGLGPQVRKTVVDREQWDQCQSCPSFTACRDLSFASLLTHIAFR